MEGIAQQVYRKKLNKLCMATPLDETKLQGAVHFLNKLDKENKTYQNMRELCDSYHQPKRSGQAKRKSTFDKSVHAKRKKPDIYGIDTYGVSLMKYCQKQVFDQKIFDHLNNYLAICHRINKNNGREMDLRVTCANQKDMRIVSRIEKCGFDFLTQNDNILLFVVKDYSFDPAPIAVYLHLDVKNNEIYLAKRCVLDNYLKNGLSKAMSLLTVLVALQMRIPLITVEAVVPATMFVNKNFGFIQMIHKQSTKLSLETKRLKSVPEIILGLKKLTDDGYQLHCSRRMLPSIVLKKGEKYLDRVIPGRLTESQVIKVFAEKNLPLKDDFSLIHQDKDVFGKDVKSTEVYQVVA